MQSNANKKGFDNLADMNEECYRVLECASTHDNIHSLNNNDIAPLSHPSIQLGRDICMEERCLNDFTSNPSMPYLEMLSPLSMSIRNHVSKETYSLYVSDVN